MPFYFPPEQLAGLTFFSRPFALQSAVRWIRSEVQRWWCLFGTKQQCLLAYTSFSVSFCSRGVQELLREETTKARRAWRTRSKTVKETTIPSILWIGLQLTGSAPAGDVPRSYKEFGRVLGTTSGCWRATCIDGLERELIQVGISSALIRTNCR